MMVKIISSGGGDVLKFAGDAMIVLWPPDKSEHVDMRLRRAAQCALYIQQKLDQATLEDDVSLSVKVGIGYGTASVIHIGGTYHRMEYLAVGDPLIQVCVPMSSHLHNPTLHFPSALRLSVNTRVLLVFVSAD